MVNKRDAGDSLIPQHKRMAMGMEIPGGKAGSMPKPSTKPEPASEPKAGYENYGRGVRRTGG